MAACDQGFGYRGRAIAFGVTGVGCKSCNRRYADCYLGREPIAAGRCLAQRRPYGMKLVMIVAKRADYFQPATIPVLELYETSGNGPASAGSRNIGVAARVCGLDVVVEGVEAVSDGILPIPDIEARSVMNIETDSIEQITSPIANAAGDIVAGDAGTAISRAAGRVVMGLGLIVIDAIAVQGYIPIEQCVVRLRIAPAQCTRVVLGIRGIDG